MYRIMNVRNNHAWFTGSANEAKLFANLGDEYIVLAPGGTLVTAGGL